MVKRMTLYLAHNTRKMQDKPKLFYFNPVLHTRHPEYGAHQAFNELFRNILSSICISKIHILLKYLNYLFQFLEKKKTVAFSFILPVSVGNVTACSSSFFKDFARNRKTWHREMEVLSEEESSRASFPWPGNLFGGIPVGIYKLLTSRVNEMSIFRKKVCIHLHPLFLFLFSQKNPRHRFSASSSRRSGATNPESHESRCQRKGSSSKKLIEWAECTHKVFYAPQIINEFGKSV